MQNPLVKTIFSHVDINCGRVQVDQLAARATLATMFQGYGLPLEELCLSDENHEAFLVRHSDKLNSRGSSFSITKRDGSIFVLHTCVWGSCCEVFEEELHSNGRIWVPEYGHRIIVPKIN